MRGRERNLSGDEPPECRVVRRQQSSQRRRFLRMPVNLLWWFGPSERKLDDRARFRRIGERLKGRPQNSALRGGIPGLPEWSAEGELDRGDPRSTNCGR